MRPCDKLKQKCGLSKCAIVSHQLDDFTKPSALSEQVEQGLVSIWILTACFFDQSVNKQVAKVSKLGKANACRGTIAFNGSFYNGREHSVDPVGFNRPREDGFQECWFEHVNTNPFWFATCMLLEYHICFVCLPFEQQLVSNQPRVLDTPMF